MGPNPGNPTHKSDLALGFVQGNIYIVQETFRTFIHNEGSAAEVMRPIGMDGLHYCVGVNIATTNPIHLVTMTTTHAWGSSRSCRYIYLRRKRVSGKVALKHLTFVVALECQFFFTTIYIV